MAESRAKRQAVDVDKRGIKQTKLLVKNNVIGTGRLRFDCGEG